jgi:hypothetical protein
LKERDKILTTEEEGKFESRCGKQLVVDVRVLYPIFPACPNKGSVVHQSPNQIPQLTILFHEGI